MKFIQEIPNSTKVISVLVMILWSIYPNWVQVISNWISIKMGGGEIVEGALMMMLSALSLVFIITFIILLFYYPIMGIKIILRKFLK